MTASRRPRLWSKTLLAPALTLAATAALVPTAAGADGLPLPVEDTGPTGIADPEGVYRFISTEVGADTLVQRTVQNGGQVSRSRLIEGTFTIPAVAVDGTPAGLAADGETLVLIRPRPRPFLPRRSTAFVVIDTERLKVRDTIRLGGDFSFDAISPDGRWMYLIEYVSRRDLSRYRVRRYDLDRGRLEPGAILDPDEAAQAMAGYPMARETSRDGRWAYTLYGRYDRRGSKPFIHALDTERSTAVCIDLPSLEGTRDLAALGLDPDPAGTGLIVTKRGEPAALVDTETFEVTEPPPPTAEAPVTSDEGGGAPWLVVGTGLAVALGAVGLITARRRRRLAALPADPFGGDDREPEPEEVRTPAGAGR